MRYLMMVTNRKRWPRRGKNNGVNPQRRHKSRVAVIDNEHQPSDAAHGVGIAIYDSTANGRAEGMRVMRHSTPPHAAPTIQST